MERLFVGDVQGCADELDELLLRAQARFGDAFELWQVGDLVNRGPSNLRVLERVRGLAEQGRAHCVLGNHETALLEVAFGLRPLRPEDTYGDVLESSEARDWIEWLRRLPLVRTGEIAGTPFVMLHAAPHPRWGLDAIERAARRVEARLAADDVDEAVALLSSGAPDRLDPVGDGPADAEEGVGLHAEASVLRRFTLCRSVPSREGWSSREPRTPREAWHRVWARQRHPYGVVYGHWARQRLHVAPGLRGLDTGCVHHGRGQEGHLTAWLPDSGRRCDSGVSPITGAHSDASGEESRPRGESAFALPDDRFWKVRARRQYYVSPKDPSPSSSSSESKPSKTSQKRARGG